MKYFLIWAFITATGDLQFTQVAEFKQMRHCLEMKRELAKDRGKWARGGFNCVWVRQ